MTNEYGFFIVNATQHHWAAWFDTDVLPAFEELPESFARPTDWLQLVELTQQMNDHYGLPYSTAVLRVLDERNDRGTNTATFTIDWKKINLERQRDEPVFDFKPIIAPIRDEP